MTLADMAAYAPRRSEALCRPYRVWTVCEPPAPSGGVATLIGLGIGAGAHGKLSFALPQRILRTVNTQFVRIEQRLDQIQSLRQGYAVGSPNISHV